VAVLRNVVVKIGADISELQKSLNEASKSLNKAGESLTNVGGAMTTGLTLPIAAATAGILKLGVDFDDALDRIRVGTGATGKALEGLHNDFRAVYTRVPAGMAEVSTAIADLNTRTGLAGKPLQKLATQMLNLSRITGEDLSGMIATSSRLFGDWSIAADDTAGTMDYLFKVSQSTGIGFNELNARLVQFGAPLRQMGFDLETAAAMLGKFEKEGVNAELVLGGLRVALGRMAKEGITDTKAALEEVTKRIKDAGSTGEANALALEIFGARVGPDMAAAIREGRFELTDLVATLKASGETINVAAAETMDFSEQLVIVRNRAAVALEPLGIALMQAINAAMPAIERLIDRLTLLVDWFTSLNSGSQRAVLTLIALAAAIGPMLLLLGSLASGLSAIIGIFSATTVAVKALTIAKALLVIKVLAVIAIIAALVIGIVWLIRNWDLVKESVVSFTRDALARFTELGARLAVILRGLGTNIAQVWSSTAAGALSQISAMRTGLIARFESIWAYIKAIPTQAALWGRNIIRGLWDGINSMAATLKKNITDFINANIPATIKRLLGISSPAKLLWNFGESVGVGLQKGILSTRNLVESAAKTLTGAALPDRELQLALAGGQNEQRTMRREIVIELRGGPQELNNNTFKELLRQVLREPEIMRDLDNIGFESLTTRVRPRGGL
jgi:TP901 family phage tail tape measure protein